MGILRHKIEGSFRSAWLSGQLSVVIVSLPKNGEGGTSS